MGERKLRAVFGFVIRPLIPDSKHKVAIVDIHDSGESFDDLPEAEARAKEIDGWVEQEGKPAYLRKGTDLNQIEERKRNS